MMHDGEQRYNRTSALRVARELDAMGFGWLEAPLPDQDLIGYADLRRRVGVPILAGGNTILDLQSVSTALRLHPWDALRFDVTVAGGFTPCRKLVGLAEGAGLWSELQSWGYTLIQAANLHLGPGPRRHRHVRAPGAARAARVRRRATRTRSRRTATSRRRPRPASGIDVDWERMEPPRARASFTCERMIDWAGTIAGVALPLHDDESIDWDSLESHLETFPGCGLTGVVVNADTGEGGLLTRREREQVLRFAVEQIGDRVPVTAGLLPGHTPEVADEARAAGELGAAAFQVFTPPAFLGAPLAAEPVVAYYEAIAAATDVPLIAYSGAGRPGGDVRARRAAPAGRACRASEAIKESSWSREGFADARLAICRRRRTRSRCCPARTRSSSTRCARAPTARCWPRPRLTRPSTRRSGSGAARTRRPHCRPRSTPTSTGCSRPRCATSAAG